jgi:hypothetical protein
MYKIAEQFNKDMGRIIYTVYDDNNEMLCKFTSKENAKKYIKVWQEVDELCKNKEGKGCNV